MIIKSLPKLFFLIACMFLSANILKAQSETEPNNTRAQANNLALNGSKSGALNVAGDVDWYKVTTTSDGQLNIAFNNTGNQDLKVVTLYDKDGVTALNSSGIGNGIGGFNTDGLAAGTFYVEVSGRLGEETGAYTLSNTLVIAAKANDIEPNGTYAQALKLNLDDSTTGHLGYYYNHQRDTTDWYKITTNADGKLDITFDNTYQNDLKTVILFDTTGSPELTGTSVGNGIGGLSYDGLAAGTYYIEITGGAMGSYNDFGPYTLKDSLEVSPKPNDKEPNNIISKAERLALNGSTTGHLGYYYNHQKDSTDWYKVTTNVDGKLDIIFDNTYQNDAKSVILFDTTGTPQLTSANVGNGIGGFSYDGLAAGTYYIEITGGNFGPYTLKDSLEVAAKKNDKEPNDNFSKADILAVNDSATGHYGYYFYSRRDTSDWYKINIISRGKLKLVLDNSGNADLVTLNLYDASGTTLIQGANIGDGIGEIETDTLSTGIYYVQITGGANGSYNDFGPYTLTDSLYSNLLPVTFISFNGVLQNNAAILNWTTANEINNKGYEVQRSNEGLSFTDIGFVTPYVKSSIQNNYSYTDNKVLSGTNYYRLKQIDNDGKFNYSSIVKLDYSKFVWSILGNSSKNSLVQLQLDKNANVIIQIISLSGKIIQTINKGNIAAGTYTILLNLNNKEGGIYIVKLIVDGKSYSKEIMQ